jgi:predicted NAD/FAD-binding protein
MLRHLGLLLPVCRHEQQPAKLSQEPVEAAAREQWIEGVALAAWPAGRAELPWRPARVCFRLLQPSSPAHGF